MIFIILPPGVIGEKRYSIRINVNWMDYLAVSQAAKRFEQKSEVNDEIKEKMQKVITALKKR